MHIVFLTHEYPKKGLNGGGIGSFVQFLGRKLIKENINVSVIGINNNYQNEYEEDYGVQVYRIAKSKWKAGKFYQNTRRLLNKINELDSIKKVDIVEGSELNFAFFPKKTTYKKVIRLHGGHHFFAIELGKKPALWRSYQEKRSFKKADAYIAVSNYVGKQTQKYLQYSFPFTTIYNSVDTDKFKPNEEKKIEVNSLLFVGTVCEKKGIRQLVQAIPFIKKNITNINLKIIGRDWFFPNGDSYIEYLKTFINDEVKDNIEIIGAVPHSDIPKYLEKANICVFPSHMEAMPIAWLEALSQGKMVVGGDIGPGKEAIIHNKTGVLVNPHNPKEISKAIIKVLSEKEFLIKLGLNARNDVKKRFNVNNIVNRNIDFYNQILK